MNINAYEIADANLSISFYICKNKVYNTKQNQNSLEDLKSVKNKARYKIF